MLSRPVIMKNKSTNNEKQAVSRRDVLRGGSALAAASMLAGPLGAQKKRQVGGPRGAGATRDVYVQIFLRGAMDGLSTLIPYLETEYYSARPSIAVPPPGQPGGALDLDGFFGLNPNAGALMTPFNAGHLAFVHAAGSTDPSRSHFDAFTKMEFGEPGLPPGTATEGWLTRYLRQLAGPSNGVLRGVGLDDVLPKTLAAAPNALPIPSPANFLFPGNPASAQERSDLLSNLFMAEAPPVGPTALDTFAAIELISSVDFAGYVPAGGAQYPATRLGDRLKDAAALIKAGKGVEAITIDFGTWDHHANQDPNAGLMAGMLAELAQGMEAFYIDMLSMINNVTLVCMTEFGRRLAENSSLGSDHGPGGVMMAMGGGIQGGQVISNWPGLQPGQLDSGDLAVTIDYRDILGEILDKRLGATDLAGIFEQHTFQTHGIAF